MTKNQLDRATSLLDQYRAGTLPKTVSDSQLWQARKSAWQCVRLCRSRLCAASPCRTRSAGLTWCCARRLAVRDGVIHPDTGEVIPVPFRMSFFVFANVPICVGMLLTAPTVRGRLCASATSCDHGAVPVPVPVPVRGCGHMAVSPSLCSALVPAVACRAFLRSATSCFGSGPTSRTTRRSTLATAMPP